VQHRRALVTAAAQTLRASQMAVFDERSGNLYVTGEWSGLVWSCLGSFVCRSLSLTKQKRSTKKINEKNERKK